MLSTKNIICKLSPWILISVLLLSACGNNSTPEVTQTSPSGEPTATPTPVEPTPTPIPAAAVVNGERIPSAWFESEFERYNLAQEAAGQPVEDDAQARQTVLDDLIDQVLLAQGARENGLSVEDAAVQSRIDALTDEVDLTGWMAQWGYTEDDLFQSLKLQMLAALQRDWIAETVPTEMEQVELRQVFAYTQEGAKNAQVSLNSGRDFDEVASIYDPTTGGYLGWVPRGYLLIPAVEDAAFSLNPGEYSDIIESDIGYHIVKVIAREVRPLSYDARLTLQRNTVHAWLEEQRQNASIEILIN